MSDGDRWKGEKQSLELQVRVTGIGRIGTGDPNFKPSAEKQIR